MCGRYALALWPRRVRERLNDSSMPSQEAPDDSDPRIRQTHNFAPGYYGLIYRADAPDHGAAGRTERTEPADDAGGASGTADKTDRGEHDASVEQTRDEDNAGEDDANVAENGSRTKYKIQAMQWGLIPFWTKRNPGYGSMLKTINCRDDSLATSGGMWNTMKQRKRCVVIAQGFYEWLKKDGGKTKIPHYTTRKDGQLMCFAGLWDSVKYEDADEKLYTYTIITTDANKQLSFLHDRMPVILDNGSDDMFRWLDPGRSEWSAELQKLLKPFKGELECYPVSQGVNKVGNDSPSFIVPVDSAANKQNIANFFGKSKGIGAGEKHGRDEGGDGPHVAGQADKDEAKPEAVGVEATINPDEEDGKDEEKVRAENKPRHENDVKREEDLKDEESAKLGEPRAKKMRSAVSNGTKTHSKSIDGSKKITSFFTK